MNFAAIIQIIGPILVSLLSNVAKTTTPIPPVIQGNSQGANQAIKDLQALLNVTLNLNPPLEVDGWLGPKTNAAIEQGIALIKRTLGIA